MSPIESMKGCCESMRQCSLSLAESVASLEARLEDTDGSVLVDEAELERLQALERKVEVFFASLSMVGREIAGPGSIRVGYAYSKSSHYFIDDAGNFITCDSFGDAMRKAFERYEVIP